VLEQSDFLSVIAHAPLVSFDFIIFNMEGKVLLGQRVNAPAKGYWFVPGGRIFKDESFDDAFERLSRNELGKAYPLSSAQFAGVFEHHYPDNVVNNDFSTHYIAIAMRLQLDEISAIPLQQHTAYQWFDIDTLMASTEVHQYTKNYFISTKGLR
jgi:colanic acid biosynthesis protein WcaH